MMILSIVAATDDVDDILSDLQNCQVIQQIYVTASENYIYAIAASDVTELRRDIQNKYKLISFDCHKVKEVISN